MVQEYVHNKKEVLPWVIDIRRRNSNADEILLVLKRAAEDDEFIAQLTDHGSKALRGYDLSQTAKAALVSGDIQWVEAQVGKLTARLRTWLDCRLQQEIW